MSTQIGDDTGPGANEPASDRPMRVQYSTRDLLATVLFTSLGCGIVFGFPDWLASAVAISVSILIAAVFVVAIVSSRGGTRVFCIGALFPTGVVALAAGGFYIFLIFQRSESYFGPAGSNVLMDSLERFASSWRFAIATAWPLAIVAGALSVLIRRQLVRSRDRD